MGKEPGGNGSFIEIAPKEPLSTSILSSDNTSILYPGIATVGEPFFIGKVSIPIGFAAIGHPVSVCHQ